MKKILGKHRLSYYYMNTGSVIDHEGDRHTVVQKLKLCRGCDPLREHEQGEKIYTWELGVFSNVQGDIG